MFYFSSLNGQTILKALACATLLPISHRDSNNSQASPERSMPTQADETPAMVSIQHAEPFVLHIEGPHTSIEEQGPVGRPPGPRHPVGSRRPTMNAVSGRTRDRPVASPLDGVWVGVSTRVRRGADPASGRFLPGAGGSGRLTPSGTEPPVTVDTRRGADSDLHRPSCDSRAAPAAAAPGDRSAAAVPAVTPAASLPRVPLSRDYGANVTRPDRPGQAGLPSVCQTPLPVLETSR